MHKYYVKLMIEIELQPIFHSIKSIEFVVQLAIKFDPRSTLKFHIQFKLKSKLLFNPNVRLFILHVQLRCILKFESC